jgi:hypothetical protein
MATFAKLRTGAWGVRVIGAAPVVGATVEVTKRSGEISTVVIDRVVWAGADRSGRPVALCTIGSDRNGRSAHTCSCGCDDPRDCTCRRGGPRSRRGGCGCGCGDCSPRCRCDARCVCRGGNIYDC